MQAMDYKTGRGAPFMFGTGAEVAMLGTSPSGLHFGAFVSASEVRCCAGSDCDSQHVPCHERELQARTGASHNAQQFRLCWFTWPAMMAQMHTRSLCSGAKHTMRQLGQ